MLPYCIITQGLAIFTSKSVYRAVEMKARSEHYRDITEIQSTIGNHGQ